MLSLSLQECARAGGRPAAWALGTRARVPRAIRRARPHGTRDGSSACRDPQHVVALRFQSAESIIFYTSRSTKLLPHRSRRLSEETVPVVARYWFANGDRFHGEEF